MLEIIYLLTALLVFEQIFFFFHIQRLVDKVMSRDFHDYQKSLAAQKRTKASEDTKSPALADSIELQDLNFLNSIVKG